jgi:hypothetical protein
MKRPETTQAVIDAFSKILDSQDQKGIKKYGTTIDEAKNSVYDWNLMALEECADCFKYLIKENIRLKMENQKLHEENELLRIL